MRIEDIQFYQLRPCRTKRRKKIGLKKFYQDKINKNSIFEIKAKSIKELAKKINKNS